MLRARGKIEIRLHFRESWRVGGSTARARSRGRAAGFLLEKGRGGGGGGGGGQAPCIY